MSYTSQYPWRTRLGFGVGGHMFYVDVCESECLDVAHALFATRGVESLVLYVRGNIPEYGLGYDVWRYRSEWDDGREVGYSGH